MSLWKLALLVIVLVLAYNVAVGVLGAFIEWSSPTCNYSRGECGGCTPHHCPQPSLY